MSEYTLIHPWPQPLIPYMLLQLIHTKNSDALKNILNYSYNISNLWDGHFHGFNNTAYMALTLWDRQNAYNFADILKRNYYLSYFDSNLMDLCF